MFVATSWVKRGERDFDSQRGIQTKRMRAFLYFIATFDVVLKMGANPNNNHTMVSRQVEVARRVRTTNSRIPTTHAGSVRHIRGAARQVCAVVLNSNRISRYTVTFVVSFPLDIMVQ